MLEQSTSHRVRLSPEREAELGRAIQGGDPAAVREVADEFRSSRSPACCGSRRGGGCGRFRWMS